MSNRVKPISGEGNQTTAVKRALYPWELQRFLQHALPTDGQKEQMSPENSITPEFQEKKKDTWKPLSRVQNPIQMISNHHIPEQPTYIATQWEIGVTMDSETHH